MKTIGIFGGTFDPPHVAHLILASDAQEQLCLDRVLWVLTPLPPHKPDQKFTTLSIRKDMVLAAISGNSGFEFSSVDIDRDPPYYAVDTVRILRQKFANARIVYIMGSDSLCDLPNWFTPDQFIHNCDAIGVMKRQDAFVDLNLLRVQLPNLDDKIQFINVPLIELSSSEIRRRAANGIAFRYYLPERVFDLVVKHNLYLH